jgi:nucleoside-diphosphate-sugar epimerase
VKAVSEHADIGKVLVTGGAGYVGTTLVPHLLRRGTETVVLDNRFETRLDTRLDTGESHARGDPAGAFHHYRGYSHIRGSILDPGTLERAAEGCGAVIHLAALSGYPQCRREPARAREVNVKGTRAVVKAAGDDKLVIFASTGSCYGAVKEGICTEETPLNPVSIYGKTKAEAEKICRDGCRSIIFRFATGYGVSPAMRLDLLINDFVYRGIHEKALAVYEPDARRSFLHVMDFAEAFLFALDNRERMAGDTYNVGDEEQNLTKRQICDLIVDRLPDVKINEIPGKDPDRRDYTVSYEKITQLGFRARVSVREGIEELFRSLQSRDS